MTRLASLLAALRLLLRQIWAGSAVLACPESYVGGGWEPGACEKCEARGSCQEVALLP